MQASPPLQNKPEFLFGYHNQHIKMRDFVFQAGEGSRVSRDHLSSTLLFEETLLCSPRPGNLGLKVFPHLTSCEQSLLLLPVRQDAEKRACVFTFLSFAHALILITASPHHNTWVMLFWRTSHEKMLNKEKEKEGSISKRKRKKPISLWETAGPLKYKNEVHTMMNGKERPIPLCSFLSTDSGQNCGKGMEKQGDSDRCQNGQSKWCSRNQDCICTREGIQTLQTSDG